MSSFIARRSRKIRRTRKTFRRKFNRLFKNNRIRPISTYDLVGRAGQPQIANARLKYSENLQSGTVLTNALPYAAQILYGNFSTSPLPGNPNSHPNQYTFYTDHYQWQYTYAARIRVRLSAAEWNNAGDNLTGIRFGVTAASLQGGIGTPALNIGTFHKWSDSNMTASGYWNINGSGQSDYVDLYVPTSYFQDRSAQLGDWSSPVGSVPARKWFFLLWATTDNIEAGTQARPTWQIDVTYYVRYSNTRDDNIVLAE